MNRDNSAPNGGSRHPPSQPGKRLGPVAYVLAGIPFFAVSFGVCFANRDEPVLVRIHRSGQRRWYNYLAPRRRGHLFGKG